MQVCRVCGIEQPLDHFEEYNKEHHWRRKTCRQCKSAKDRAYRERSKEQIRANKRRYHAEHREEILARVNEWVANNPDKRRKNALEYYYRLQDAAINAYGGYRCVCCGEDEPMFLSLDHVNNDGRQHRDKIGITGGARYYKWLKDNGYPPGFQVLCMNCNHGRFRNGGTCPHKFEEACNDYPARE